MAPWMPFSMEMPKWLSDWDRNFGARRPCTGSWFMVHKAVSSNFIKPKFLLERFPPRWKELSHWIPPPSSRRREGCVLVLLGFRHEGAPVVRVLDRQYVEIGQGPSSVSSLRSRHVELWRSPQTREEVLLQPAHHHVLRMAQISHYRLLLAATFRQRSRDVPSKVGSSDAILGSRAYEHHLHFA